jgi:hypothetical protein
MASEMDGIIAMDNAEVMKGALFLNYGFGAVQERGAASL